MLVVAIGTQEVDGQLDAALLNGVGVNRRSFLVLCRASRNFVANRRNKEISRIESPSPRQFNMSTVITPDRKTSEWLTKNRFDINNVGEGDITPLHLAAMIGNARIVKKLVEQGGNVHSTDKIYKYTPLHLASMGGRFGNNMDDASDLMAHYRHSSSFEYNPKPSYESTILALLNAGADVNARDIRGCTALHYVAQQKKPYQFERKANPVNHAKVLLKAGADVNVEDFLGRRPLDYAMRQRSAILVYVLRKADGDSKDSVSDDSLIVIDTVEKDIQDLLTYMHGVEISDVFKEEYDLTPHMVVEHLIKLTSADIPISDELKEYRDRNMKCRHFPAGYTDIAYWKEKRKLKKMMLARGVSLYRWLRMDSRRRFGFIVNMPHNLADEFPHYHSIIRIFCEEAVIRSQLIEPAKLAYQSVTGRYWPDLCLEHILQYFNDNWTLRKLIDSAVESED